MILLSHAGLVAVSIQGGETPFGVCWCLTHLTYNMRIIINPTVNLVSYTYFAN
jgi:hypothetical protein